MSLSQDEHAVGDLGARGEDKSIGVRVRPGLRGRGLAHGGAVRACWVVPYPSGLAATKNVHAAGANLHHGEHVPAPPGQSFGTHKVGVTGRFKIAGAA